MYYFIVAQLLLEQFTHLWALFVSTHKEKVWEIAKRKYTFYIYMYVKIEILHYHS